MKSSDHFRLSPRLVLRRSVWILPLLGFFFFLDRNTSESSQDLTAVENPQPMAVSPKQKEEFSSLPKPLRTKAVPENKSFKLESFVLVGSITHYCAVLFYVVPW